MIHKPEPKPKPKPVKKVEERPKREERPVEPRATQTVENAAPSRPVMNNTAAAPADSQCPCGSARAESQPASVSGASAGLAY